MLFVVLVDVALLVGEAIFGGEQVSMRFGATPSGSANLKQVRLFVLCAAVVLLLLDEPFS